MTPLLLGLLLLSQLALVAGQIFLKKGMTAKRRASLVSGLAIGLVLLTAWFLLWMGLLQKLDISTAFPFQGIGPVLTVLASMLFLREHVGWPTWLGVVLIAAGTVLVAI